MSIARIQQSFARIVGFYTEHPHKARSTDSAAQAVVEQGLRRRVEGPDGAALVTDMPQGIGGTGSAPTPGWMLRAALASCDASMIALRAAQLGVELTRLQVEVDSDTDNRGLVGLGDAVPAGPLAVRVQIRIAADGATEPQLREIVEWAEAHSPVGDALRRAIPCRTQVAVG